MNSTPNFDRQQAVATQTELDGLVVTIELTLISIIQGVALSFLTEHSLPQVTRLQFARLPYVATGLLVILLFWSRSLIHTLTVIRYPLELGHNFLYVACTFVEAVLFTQVADPFRWYVLNVLFASLVWVLFGFDRRLIRSRMRDSAGPVGSRLYEIVEREQLLHMRLLMPATLIFNLLAAFAIYRYPVLFIERGGHSVIATLQLMAAAAYLAYSSRFFARITPLISVTRKEWRDDVLHSEADASQSNSTE